MQRKKLEKILEKNLTEIKKRLPLSWRKLKPENIENIKTYQDLVNLLKQEYEYSEEKINLQIKNFLKRVYRQPKLPEFNNLRQALYQIADDQTDK